MKKKVIRRKSCNCKAKTKRKIRGSWGMVAHPQGHVGV